MKIILIGFMGSGKTTVAKELSKRLGIGRIEMDAEVVRLSGRKDVNEIFEKDGEIKFRELEIEFAKSIRDLKEGIISTGGGVVQNKIILDILRENAEVIYLQLSFEKITKILANDETRPLFKDREKAKKLFELRRPLYEAYADVIIDREHKYANQLADEIIKKLT
jgi:shikimate kinase